MCNIGVTVTSSEELHKQADRAKKTEKTLERPLVCMKRRRSDKLGMLRGSDGNFRHAQAEEQRKKSRRQLLEAKTET